MSFEHNIKRTTIALAVVSVGLMAFIALVDRNTLSSGELAQRRGQLIQAFVRDRVTKLVLEREDGRIVLERHRDDDGEVGEWNVTEPVAWPADPDATDSLLGALEWARARRTLEGVTAEDRARFGLDTPRFRASFTVANQEIPILVGGEDPQGGGSYLALDDESVAYVVGTDVVEALDQNAEHFRDHELYTRIGTSRTKKLRIARDDASAIVIEREGERFVMVEPLAGFAGDGAVRNLLRVLSDLRATRFVTDDAEVDLESFGLDGASLAITLDVPGGPGVRDAMTLLHIDGTAVSAARPPANTQRGDEAPVSIGLAVGAPCGEHEEERYARLGQGPIVCVAASALEVFFAADPGELREPRLVTMADETLARLVVDGREHLEITRGDERWTLTAAGEERPMDEAALSDLMRDLRSVRAVAYLPADQASLRAHGLLTPRMTLTLTPDDGDPEVVTIGAATSAGLYARRGEEAVILELSLEAEPLLHITPIRLRSKLVVDEDLDEATSMLITRGSIVEEVERVGAEWRVKRPVEIPADLAATRDALRAVAQLNVVRFVSEAATAAHGLAAPRFVIDARFERRDDEAHVEAQDDDDHAHSGETAGEEHANRPAIREVALRIGAATDDGAFAQLVGDAAVFVVAESVVEALRAPLAARDALATELDQIAAVTIERPGMRVALVRGESGYVTEDGGAPDATRTRALMDAIATLRATDMGAYNAAPGTEAPRARVTITRTDTAPEPRSYTVLIGAATTTERVSVTLANSALTVLVAPATVEPFLTYTP